MGSEVMSDRVASGWKRKQVKKLVKQAEKPGNCVLFTNYLYKSPYKWSYG